MKGLILCAGKGTRMRPITYALPKQMIPVANKPVIVYAFEAMKEAGVTDLGIVVSDNRKDIEPFLGDGSQWGMNITYVTQDKTLGIAHAVLCAEDYIAGDDFILFLGDNLLEKGIKPLADEFLKEKPQAAIMLKEVPEPQHFGVAEVTDGKITSIVEKPKEPKSNLAVIGVYIFTPIVFEAAKRIKPSKRGELEITDTIAEIINMGGKVSPHVVDGWWKDTGQKGDMIEANRAALQLLTPTTLGTIDSSSQITGTVVIETGASIIDSKICGPAIIGKNTTIESSYIGPYTSIDDNCTIIDSEIDNSIIMSGSTIANVASRIENSLIGHDVTIEGVDKRPISIDITVGDKCKLILP